MRANFCSGSRPASTSAIPASRAIGSAARRRSPVSINSRPIPISPRPRMQAGTPSRTRSRKKIAPASRPSSATQMAVAPIASHCSINDAGTAVSPSATNFALPARTLRPRTIASTPRPGTAIAFPASGVGIPRRKTSSTTTRASGWLETRSTLAARPSRSSSVRSSATSRAISNCPSVMVPVLSKTTVSTLAASCRMEAPRTRMPRRARPPMAATIAVGVARIRAHGHATISTDTVRIQSRVKYRVSAADSRRAGRKYRAQRSARRSTGARFS